jgi:enoyl-CoA hydratase
MDLIKVELESRIATLTLDDPNRRNAMSFALADEMVATFDRLEADPQVGAVILTGHPPAFCAGADLSQLEGAVRQGLERIYQGFLRISRSTLPSIAAVNGPAIGAGVNLALVCDLRIAARSARFESRFLDLGLHPGGGHTWMLRHIGGSQLPPAMTLFGEALDGIAAAEHGLVWRCVDDDALLPEAKRLASRVASAPPRLVHKLKSTLAGISEISDQATAVDKELDPQAWSVQQPEFAERLAAAKKGARRPPKQ